MKKKEREALAAALPNLLNAVVEQGKAYQRLEDAQADVEFENNHAKYHLDEVMALINKPEKEEIN